VADIHALAASLGRTPVQRTTLYKRVQEQQQRADEPCVAQS
jgi:2-iminoacetate synthase ThiH